MEDFAAISVGRKSGEGNRVARRVLLQFYRAVNLLTARAPMAAAGMVARWLDLGKPRELIELQRSAAFKNEIPRVIRRTFC